MTKQILATIALFLVTAQASYAGTKYQVKLNGTMVKDAAATSLYGNTAASNPFVVSFKIDSDKAILVPAGSTYSAGLTMANDSYRISKLDVTDFVFSLPGATFTTANLQPQELGQLGNFDILVEGPLSAPTSINLILASSAGEFYGGVLDCPDTTCTNILLSYTFSYADNGAGYAEADIHIGAEEDVPPPPVLTAAQKTSNLLVTLSEMKIKNVLTKLALTLELKVIQKLIADNKVAKAKCAIDLFKASVKVALKGKTLTQAQADTLTAGALDIQSSLQ